LTPEKAVERKMNLAGVNTEREDKVIDTTLEGRVIDNKTGQFNLNVLEREVDRAEKILSRAAPDVYTMARMVALGKEVPNDSLERINADPNLRKGFEDYVKGFQMEIEINARKALQRMRGPQEQMFALQYLDKLLGENRMQLSIAEQNIRGKNGMLLGMGLGVGGQQGAQAEFDNVQILRARSERLTASYMELMKDLGVDIEPQVEVPPPSNVPTSPRMSDRPSLDQLRQGGLFGNFNTSGTNR
jgi:hypothetical protein